MGVAGEHYLIALTLKFQVDIPLSALLHVEDLSLGIGRLWLQVWVQLFKSANASTLSTRPKNQLE